MKKQDKSGRFLITVNVVGSSGPIKFVTDEEDTVARVIEKVLKLYTRQNRFPLLGSHHIKDFLLFPLNHDNALNPLEKIGRENGARSFLMSKKLNRETDQIAKATKSNNNGWKAWLNTFKIIPTM